jgi:xanthine dehydrogenase YagS FAD-binding subunit
VRDFDYLAPRDLGEATALLNDRASRAIAGGTDLLTLMKGDIFAPERLVNIKGLAGDMSGISVGQDGMRIGALTVLSEIERHPEIRDSWPALSEAASLAATPQIRNLATIGGNILQRPRCWYFRDSHVDCWLKGGDICPLHDGENRFGAIFEDSPCSAVHPSDLAPVLVALDAVANVLGPDGETQSPVEELLQPPTDDRRTESILNERQLITSVWLPRPQEGTRMTYLKAMDRKVWAFALVSVAVSLQLRGGSVTRAGIVLGGVSNVPRRAVAAASLLDGRQAASVDIERVTEECFASALVLSQNGYKVRLGKALLRRALGQLLG